jgi:hypothetical protein
VTKSDGGTWRKGLLVPDRFELAATPDAAGAVAFRALYRPRRRRARLATAVSIAALTRGIGFSSSAGEMARELCELIGVRPDGGALVRSSRSGRSTLALTAHGRPSLIVKVAPDHDRIRHEAEALRRVRDRIPGVIAPAVRWVGPWREQLAVATDALVPTRVGRDVDLGEALEVAVALARGAAHHGPVVHGDLAPWNLVHTAHGIALVDWESSRFGLDPMHDLAHFVTSTGALLGTYEPAAAVGLLTAKASPGWRYLDALGIDPDDAPGHVRRYLEGTSARGNRVTRRYRAAMLDRLPQRSPSPVA